MSGAKSAARKVPPGSTVDEAEIRHFAKDSTHWWDENGPFKPLHKANPTRLKYIKAQICAHFGRDENALNALEGLKILDVGCGGGLVGHCMVSRSGLPYLAMSRMPTLKTAMTARMNSMQAARRASE